MLICCRKKNDWLIPASFIITSDISSSKFGSVLGYEIFKAVVGFDALYWNFG